MGLFTPKDMVYDSTAPDLEKYEMTQQDKDNADELLKKLKEKMMPQYAMAEGMNSDELESLIDELDDKIISLTYSKELWLKWHYNEKQHTTVLGVIWKKWTELYGQGKYFKDKVKDYLLGDLYVLLEHKKRTEKEKRERGEFDIDSIDL